MGMTTERIIEIFNDHDRISGIILRGNSEEETKFNCETIEALQSINVILRKYQKIEQIMEDYQRYPMDCLFNVREVLDNGNNGV